MKKPPKRLVIKPGRYRTRGKGTAVITHISKDTVFPVRGSFDGRPGFSWTADGRGSSLPNDDTMYDLTFRLLNAKPAKRERMEWCVVLPYENKKAAEQVASHFAPWTAHVRRLPLLPATRKEKS